ncbi:DEAD/DEAH box helicase [Labilithrix luteola]|uniref:DEAD/DEAH box helicase n=1 Tax=Labilithrix luteola TaxID=1391654 RepID=UPI001969B591
MGQPTDVQAQAWPRISAGETTLLLAPTGSGKTLAAFLSAIDRLARSEEPDPKARLRVLYVSPLKALAVDVEHNLRAPLRGITEVARKRGEVLRDVEAAVRTGDTPPGERTKMLRSAPDILITTPESLYLLLTSRQREILSSVDTVVIDEIHQMAANKRGAHLFLSLERLEALRGGKPVQRIGLSATQRPLEEIACMLGGFETPATRSKKAVARPVAIVDASAKKALSITVEVPPPLPIPQTDEAIVEQTRSIWPQIHVRLVERIRAARSTMIFVNSRRLAERLAAALNDVAGEELALAHHGSVAKETRKAIEEQLKSGELRAIVATSSLELGIDMGAVDQVVQVESPPSVASGIQRIGRASHHVGGVPTGVLVPKHKQDLLACAAAAAGIEAGDVEETYYLRNPLDVLAQQIVAMVAIGLTLPEATTRGRKKVGITSDRPVETDVEALWELVRHAAPFADLPRASFEGVLDMLAGRYPSDEFADLRPRITWDRKRGILTPRHGSLRLAILNGGTIPDRGLYGVFLADGGKETSNKNKSSKRVGELDEEMVFELREGEVFLLGASSWRAEEITRDRVLVTPAPGEPGKMPFWRGDRAGRTRDFGKRIGALARIIDEGPPKKALETLRKENRLDARSADDLVTYVQREATASGAVPSDRHIVVERVPDELGDLRICLLSPFGTRVHTPWAMAALARLRQARAGDIQAVWSDDGIVFRVPSGEAPPPVDLLFPSAEEIEDIVTRELGRTSLFAARFREAAGRALLLPRRSVGKRTPLWAQRKRAADLLSVATQYPSFPVVLETYRECLRDAFDMPSLVSVLSDVASRKITVTTVDLPTPSPFAASLLFSFVGNFLYDPDAPAAERRAHALTIDHAQLRELLGEAETRKLLDPEVIEEHARLLQRLDRTLRHADAVQDLLLLLGDQSEASLLARAEAPDEARAWLSELEAERRILRIRMAGDERFIAVEDAGRYRDALGVKLVADLPDAFVARVDDALNGLVARHARTHGPFTSHDLRARFGLDEKTFEEPLERLLASGKVVAGAFLEANAGADAEYCDAEVLRTLKRKTLARLRKTIEPVSPAAFARFLAEWQHVGGDRHVTGDVDARARGDLLRAIGSLEGCPVPASVLESEVLPARVPGYRPHQLDRLLATGEVVWAGLESIGGTDGRIALYLAENEPLLARLPEDAESRPSSPLHEKLRELFGRRGALFFAEIARSLGLFPADIGGALWDLVWSGEVTNDSLDPLRGLGRKEERRGRPGRAPRARTHAAEGRWSLRRSRWEKDPSPTERAAAIARSWLERYGVVLREVAQAESLTGGFGPFYDVYRALEDQGRVRRGYFVAERGAAQFALPGADERLRATSSKPREPQALVLAATDPANPWGSLLPWPASPGPRPQRAPGARVVTSDGELLGWIARGGHHLATFLPADGDARAAALDTLVLALIDLSRRERTTIQLGTIDEHAAPESPLAPLFAKHGFAARQGALVRIVDRPAREPERERERDNDDNLDDQGELRLYFPR